MRTATQRRYPDGPLPWTQRAQAYVIVGHISLSSSPRTAPCNVTILHEDLIPVHSIISVRQIAYVARDKLHTLTGLAIYMSVSYVYLVERNCRILSVQLYLYTVALLLFVGRTSKTISTSKSTYSTRLQASSHRSNILPASSQLQTTIHQRTSNSIKTSNNLTNTG